MNNENVSVVDAEAICVTVEMGDEFVPGPETAAALKSLVTALHAEHGPEVAGFQNATPAALGSFTFFSKPEPEQNFYEGWPSKWAVSEGKNKPGQK